MKVKICKNCKTPKKATLEFFKQNDEMKEGLHSYCRQCDNERSRKRYNSIKVEPSEAGVKKCTKCKIEKDVTDFAKNKASIVDGRSSWCKICHNEKSRKVKRSRKYKYKKYGSPYRINNPESWKKYYQIYRIEYLKSPSNQIRLKLAGIVANWKRNKSIKPNKICEVCCKKSKTKAHFTDLYVQSIQLSSNYDTVKENINWICMPCIYSKNNNNV